MRWSMSYGSFGSLPAKTSIDARVGSLRARARSLPQRDFDGFVGNFNLNWAVTCQDTRCPGWARDLVNFQLAPGSFQNSPYFEPVFRQLTRLQTGFSLPRYGRLRKRLRCACATTTSCGIIWGQSSRYRVEIVPIPSTRA